MILTRADLRALIKKETIRFEPRLDQFQNQPHAIDLRLGMVFYLPKIWKLTENGREIVTVDGTGLSHEDHHEKIELKPGQYFDLAPGESVLASTLEHIELLSHCNVLGTKIRKRKINRAILSIYPFHIVHRSPSHQYIHDTFSKYSRSHKTFSGLSGLYVVSIS